MGQLALQNPLDYIVSADSVVQWVVLYNQHTPIKTRQEGNALSIRPNLYLFQVPSTYYVPVLRLPTTVSIYYYCGMYNHTATLKPFC